MRPSRHEWAMSLARETAKRTTCLRRGVGCILLNERGHVIATGNNGVATGRPHCNEVSQIPVYHDDPRVLDLGDVWQFKKARTAKLVGMDPGDRACVGFDYEPIHACSGSGSPSGTNLDGCEAIHAEQNALLQCKDVWDIHTAYVTTSPCTTCVKLFLNTSCKVIVFDELYPHNTSKELWESDGREWIQFKDL